MKNKIIEEIKSFVVEENARCRMGNLWQEPMVGFADVKSEYIGKLREVVHADHQMPEEVLGNAKNILCYFIPFAEWVTESNEEPGTSSSQWAESYEITNAMMARLNEHMTDFIHKLGYEAKTAPEAAVFYRDEVISHWSFRHIAYAAGLGTFGLNNMLITDKGCSGRYNCIVTSLPIEADSPKKEAACLYIKNGTCGKCMVKCPAGAITPKRFDRHKCYEQCLKNAEIYTKFGNSYIGEDKYGSEVCGKCIAAMPCAHKRP